MVGLIGKKRGMAQIFTEDGQLIPVTVVEAGPCTVVQTKTPASDGYAAIQVGYGEQKPQRVSKAYRQHCLKAEKGVFRVLKEFRPNDDTAYEVGQELKVEDLFSAGDRIDVSGVSKGRGFSGVMKRHGYAGAATMTHGTHEYFRHGGSIGACAYPGKVFKGKGMAGQFGNEKVTVQRLQVVEIRADDNLLFIRGAVPGAKGGLVTLLPATKGAR